MLWHGIAFAGSQTGDLLQFDLRNPKTGTAMFQLGSGAALLALERQDSKSIWFTTSDGSCILYDFSQGKVIADLMGSDYDPLYDISVAHDVTPTTVFTACRDGAVRKYILS